MRERFIIRSFLLQIMNNATIYRTKANCAVRLIWHLMRRLRNCSLTAVCVLCSAEVTRVGAGRSGGGGGRREPAQGEASNHRAECCARDTSIALTARRACATHHVLIVPAFPPFAWKDTQFTPNRQRYTLNMFPTSHRPTGIRRRRPPLEPYNEQFARIHCNGTVPAFVAGLWSSNKIHKRMKPEDKDHTDRERVGLSMLLYVTYVAIRIRLK